jgi:hypothetical protein
LQDGPRRRLTDNLPTRLLSGIFVQLLAGAGIDFKEARDERLFGPTLDIWLLVLGGADVSLRAEDRTRTTFSRF